MSNMIFFISKSDVFVSVVLAYVFSASPYYIRTGSCPLNLEVCISMLLMFLGFLVLNIGSRAFLYSYFSLASAESHNHAIFHKCENILDGNYAVYKIACIILLCWLPVLIALYPGTIINDTWGQLSQFIRWLGSDGTQKVLNDHHPIFDTLFMGVLIVPFAKLTGNWNMAIFAYVILQACLTSFSFSYSVLYLRKRLGLDVICSFFLLLLYCILPLYAASVQTVSKDALFSWIYVFFFVYFIEIVRTNGAVLQERSFLYKILAAAIFCMLTKKVGIYVVLFSFISLLFAKLDNKRNIKKIIITLLVFAAGIMPLARHMIRADRGGVQEMLSIPFQQTARYVKYHPKDITLSEKAILSKVLDYDRLAKNYDPVSADPVKEYHQRGRTSDYVKYLKVWAAQLVRHPNTYIEAFQAMLSGWFSFWEYNPLMNMDWHSQLDKTLIPDWVPVRPAFAKKTADAVQNAYHTIYHTPIWGGILSYGLYAALLPAFALATALRNWNNQSVKYYLVLVPVLLSIALGCWLAPVSVHFEGRRYLYPLTYTAPLLLGWCMYIYQTEVAKAKK